MSQRARILWTIALVVLPLVALNLARIWQNYVDDREAAQAARVRLVETAALSLRVFMENNVAAVQALALHPELARGGPTAELKRFLQRVIKEKPGWVGLGVVGPDGMSIAGTAGGPPVFLGDRAYFKQAVSSGQAVVSSGIVGRVTGRTNVVIAAPFELDAGGRGVLVAPLPIEAFAGELLSLVLPQGAALAVVDSDAQVIVHSERGRARGLASLRDAPGVAQALRGDRGALHAAPAGGAELLVAYAPVRGYGWALIASEPTATAFAQARREFVERLAVLGIMLGVLAVLGWHLSGRLALAYQREVAARAEAERALRTRDDFLAAASHDLRNPLAAVRSANDMLRIALRRGVALAGERLESCVAHIDSGTRRMTALIDAFVDIAHLQTGAQLDLSLSDVDLPGLLREIADEARLLNPGHRIVLEAPEQLAVRADADRLRRAIGNLVGNAAKYSPGGGDIRLRLERADGDWAFLEVSDTGIGIPSAELEGIFERFRRGSNVIGRIPGTGIGLAGARQIIEQHGGRIEARSTLGAGTTFAVHLPCAARAAGPQGIQKEAA
jgi:signal transduction histidine kinase